MSLADGPADKNTHVKQYLMSSVVQIQELQFSTFTSARSNNPAHISFVSKLRFMFTFCLHRLDTHKGTKGTCINFSLFSCFFRKFFKILLIKFMAHNISSILLFEKNSPSCADLVRPMRPEDFRSVLVSN